MNLRMALPLAAALGSCCSFNGQVVSVDAAGQIGSAVLRSAQDDCYAITAYHVVTNSAIANVADTNRRTAVANVLKSYPQADLAILGLDRRMCSTATWPGAISATQTENIVRHSGANGKLVQTMASGSTSQIPVSITNISGGQLSVLSTSKIPIVSGWSGSGLYVSSILVGILLSVDTNTGRGNALPIDYVQRIVSDFPPFRGTSPGTDSFDIAVLSQAFHDKMSAVVQSLQSNNLERFNTNEHVYISGVEWPEDGFKSAIQLPGFNQPPVIIFHNEHCYKCSIKLSKHPLRIYFLQIFPDSYDRKRLPDRFNVLASAIENIIPGWQRSPYTHGINPLRDLRKEYRNGSMVISINLWRDELRVEVSR